ncbi:MAG: hypothetical protein LQ352_004687 [Teloschistes flavicans]|nr:MAG: hypothetical protein LQ352_004687 [Teloschistes flavicans]
MASAELSTYFLYSDGIDTSMLNLGAMVLDFKSPKQCEPYRHPQLDTQELRTWTVEDAIADAWMCHTSGGGIHVGGGLTNLAELDVAPSSSQTVLIVGKEGSKIEIREPQKFLNEVILKAFPGRLWLSSILAISLKLRIQRKLTFQNPHIWLLTGLVLLTDANSMSIVQHDSSYGGTVNVPLPDPSGVTALLQLMPQLRGKVTSSWQAGSGMRRLGNKVYAAQWQRLDVKYSSLGDDKNVLPNGVNLLNIFSARTSRGDSNVAEVSVEDAKTAPSLVGDKSADETYKTEFDDDYWRRFLQEFEKVKEDAED